MKKILIPLLLFFALGATLLIMTDEENNSPTIATEQAISVTDFTGKSRTFNKPAERIILVRSRDIYEVSSLLGDETADKVIAWGPDIMSADKDAYEQYSEHFPSLIQKPLIGDIFKDAINPEDMIRHDPDLVLLDHFMIDRKYKSVTSMETAGLPVIFTNQSSKTLENPQKGIEMLGKALGKEDKAVAINSYVNSEIESVRQRLQNITKTPPLVYIEVGNKGASEYGNTYGKSVGGSYSSWGEMIQSAKGTNLIETEGPEMPIIDREYLLKSDPDIIIVTGAYWPAVSDSMRLGYKASEENAQKILREYIDRPGWKDLKAVKNKQVYAIFHGFVMHIHNFVAYQQLAKWFYPEEFTGLDPEGKLRDFHDKFLPIKYEGTWMTKLE